MQGMRKLPESSLKIIDTNPSCKICDKVGVCGIFQAISPLLGNWKGDKKPFEVEHLGMICTYFSRKYEENL